MTNVQNVLLVEDHRAILDHLVTSAARIFGDAKLTVISDPAALDGIQSDQEFDMGLIDPGMPGIPHDNITARAKFAIPLLARVRQPDRAAVFTGIATEPERVLFKKAGFENYFSKADTSVMELSNFFANGITSNAPPKPLKETWTFLSESELSAYSLKDDHPDLSYRELAGIDGKSEEAFTQALKRARRKIREYAS